MTTDYHIMTAYNFGAEFWKAGLYQEAEIGLKTCIDMNVKGEIANMYKAACANILGVIYSDGKLGVVDPVKAIENLRIAYNLESDNGAYILNLAQSYQKIGDKQKAVELYQECLNAEVTDKFTVNANSGLH